MNTQTSSFIRGLLLRQQPGQPLAVVLKAGVGGLLAIGAVAWLSHVTGNPLQPKIVLGVNAWNTNV